MFYLFMIYWVISVVLSLTSLTILSQELKQSSYFAEYLEDGSFSKQEKSDYEWNDIKKALFEQFLLWFFCHAIFSVLLKLFCSDNRVIKLFFIAYGLIFTVHTVGKSCTGVLMMIVSSSFFLSTITCSYIACILWTFKMVVLMKAFLNSSLSAEEVYDKVLQVNTLSYGLLRCIYYCMEKMQSYKHSHSERSSHNQPTRSEPLSSSLGDKTTQLRCDQAMKYEGSEKSATIAFSMGEGNSGVVDFLLYVFYTPLLTFGQLLPYSQFKRQFEDNIASWKIQSDNSSAHGNNTLTPGKQASSKPPTPTIPSFPASALIGFLTRIFLGTLMLELSNQLTYPYTITEIENLPWEIPLLDLGGVIYLISQHFTLKYMVLWSYTSTFACLDGLTTPLLPKCTSCFFYVSDIWRCFDAGLYEFIKRCVYIPMGGRNRKLLACGFSFFFLCLWHGVSRRTFYWTTSSLISMLFEIVIVRSCQQGSRKETFLCLFNFLIFCSGVITFLTNSNVCKAFFYRIFIEGFPSRTLVLLSVLYSGLKAGRHLSTPKEPSTSDKIMPELSKT